MITLDPNSPHAKRLAIALDAVADGIALFDADDRFVVCNRLYRELCAPIADLLVPGVEFKALVRASVERGFAPTAGDSADTAIVLRLAQRLAPDEAIELLRGGRALVVRESRTPDGGTIQMIVDVTKLRVREEQKHRAEKMTALATLSSGLAHDINNVLATIRGYAELVGTRLVPDDPNAAHLTRIVANVDRATDMTRALTNFSRTRPPALHPVDLTDLVNELKPRIAALLPSRIELDIATAEQLIVNGDADDLRNAIMQIAMNARDAMPAGGTLRLALDEVPPGVGELPASAPLVSHVRLTIADSGTGMDEATRQRIFEPFFTTKPPGSGVGLGLAMTYAAVTRAGGSIAVDSQPGEGTTFRIYLPCAALTELPANDTLWPETRSTPGPRRILLVEDEPELRELLRIGLAAAGHMVVAAANGAEALRLHETTNFDLLVTDIAMPELDGVRLAAHLTAQNPGLSVIYMTGHPGRIGTAAAELPADATILWKPFAPSRLAQAVTEAA
jgi:two-component system, cell cycle sensor histidine kinase and response regulator CckA